LKNFDAILKKLEHFTRRYYINELIKGVILFFAVGLLYLIITLLIEYFLWLSPIGRTILFWLFIIVEMTLLFKLIIKPFIKLLRVQKGINNKDASIIIGNHFPEVNDRLLNLLQLKENTKHTELLLASIEQKSAQLNPIPFKLAINFNNNLKYLKYAAIPVAVLLISFSFAGKTWFSDSYKRVVHYQTAYKPPAPFQFYVLNDNLQTTESKDFKIIIKTVGDITPENPKIVFNNEFYFLQQKSPNEFEYVFTHPKQDVSFHFSANSVFSKRYVLEVIEAPALLDFQMALEYPNYTLKQDETFINTGDAMVPQGTKIGWKLNTKATSIVKLYSHDTLGFIEEEPNKFNASKRVYNNLDYSISISNDKLRDYENLNFNITVIKDEYPELKIKSEIDSLDHQTLYFYGQVSDDYGLSKLQLVYYPINDPNNKKTENIPINKSNLDEVLSVFPNNQKLEEGVSYQLYFQLFDNDAINGNKNVKSKLFTYRKLTKEEEDKNKLKEQSETISDLNKSLKKVEEQDKRLDEFSKTQKEKQALNFNDKKKLETFIKRQKDQEQMMKDFNKRLKDNLEDFQKENDKEDSFKEDLKERLKENEEQLEKDEKILKELEELQEKINKEELTEKLEQLAKQNKNKKRSLKQLLELTKRYYVGKKLEKLQEELEDQSEEQKNLSEESNENNTKEKQEALNNKFKEFQSEMEKLQKENNELRKPIDIPHNPKDEKDVNEMQKNAFEELENMEDSGDEQEKQKNQEKAKQNQKRASEKMKQMAQKMEKSMQASGGDQLNEDTEMLRQVLDNLVVFSFDQEDLMKQFKSIEINHSKYPSYLRKQSNLREHFEHIDDSLFALSLRQPKLSERVNKEIIEAFYNIDKSLELLAENKLYEGVSNQQYAITAANNLADFLSNVLDGLQEQMNPSAGQGQGDMQLPDIIMSQEALNEQMKEGLKKSDKGKKEKGKEGKDGMEGEKGKKGNQEGEGKEGIRGNNLSEGEGANGELYEIYKKQQQIKQALQDRLAKEGMGRSGDNLLNKMEEVELELLNKGFNNQTLQKMMELQHQLLKLDNATFQQGQDYKRKSESNQDQFNNTSNNKIPTARQYFNTTEILNRQALPLRQTYRKKVKEYFNTENDSL